MESFENIQETLNVAEASLAKLTIQDKCPRTLQDEMSITHELKQLRLSHNSQPKQIKMALQDYKVHPHLYYSFFTFKTFKPVFFMFDI